MMKRIFALSICLVAISWNIASAAVLVFSSNGTYVAKPSIAAAAVAADASGKTVVITSPQTVTTSIAWPTDREFKVEKSGVITFSGAGALTGLKESKPEWFGVNTTPGTTDMTVALQNSYAAVMPGGVWRLAPTTYMFSSALTWGNQVNIDGADWQKCILLKHGNFDGVTIATVGYTWMHGFYVKGDAGNGGRGIVISNGNGIDFDRISSAYHASHGIHLLSGLLGKYPHILTNNNGGDGIRIEDNYPTPGTNVAWASHFGIVDTRSNGGWGFYIVSGSANVADYIVSQFNVGQVRLGQATLTNNLTIYMEPNVGTTNGLLIETGATRNNINIIQEDTNVAYQDNGTNSTISGPGLSTLYVNSISAPKPGTNVAGRDISLQGGNATAGAAAHGGGGVSIYGGSAAGTSGNGNGGLVRLQGGTPVNAGTTGPIFIQGNGGQVVIGSETQGNSSTLVKLDSTTQAFQFNSMSTTQKNALNATVGMVVFDVTLGKLQVCTVAGVSGTWASLN